MPQLFLMCEIAASKLVTEHMSLEALALCKHQPKATRNKLTHIRSAVTIKYVLGEEIRGVDELYSMPSFKRTLKEKSEFMVPSLLMGVMETFKQVYGEKDANLENISARDSEHSRRVKGTSFFYEIVSFI